MRVLLTVVIGDSAYELADPTPENVEWLVRWRNGLRQETFEALFPEAVKRPYQKIAGKPVTGIVVDDI